MRCSSLSEVSIFATTFLLSYVGKVEAQNQSALAANLEHFWSYGRSPPVYPSPQMSGSGGWADSYEFARQLVSQMTNAEKENLTYGYVTLASPPAITKAFVDMLRQQMGARATYQLLRGLVFRVCVCKTTVTAYAEQMASVPTHRAYPLGPPGTERSLSKKRSSWAASSKTRAQM